ncbi:hypothetical protein FF38_00851 [Lucilia cuprina]|uniref:Caspase family p20 domain-containing protein n=1 Tax=Lucilia cuprina TaxID=7375 RepID=A0A0L0C1Z0_LUCCU|nr:hypothetical protein FF38_00851 [Lucilia cuprina]
MILSRLVYFKIIMASGAKTTNLILVVGSSANRDGVEDNLNNIKLLEGLYNAEVIEWLDKTDEEYRNIFRNLKNDKDWQTKFLQCNFVLVICLFHGDTDGQITFNGEITQLKCNFLNPFFSIEQLDGKLKWLVVQACRGNLESVQMKADGKRKKKYLDICMISYCTSEGMVSRQYDKNGKIFIQYLCEELADNANNNNYKTSLVTIMNNVIEKVHQYGIKEQINDFPLPVYSKNFLDYSFGQ